MVSKDNRDRKAYFREYRKKNKEHIKKTSQVRYLKNREARIKGVKEWHKRNPDYQKQRMKKRYRKEREMNLIRQKTKAMFSHLKVVCLNCGRKSKTLEFHHIPPYSYDNFQILCRNCHRKAHGTLLVEMKEDYVKSTEAPKGDKA